MIPYARPYTSPEARAKVLDLIRDGKFAPGEAAEAIENLFDGYHGVFVNSGTTANYLMVQRMVHGRTRVSVPAIAFATTYAPLVAKPDVTLVIAEEGITCGLRARQYTQGCIMDCRVLGIDWPELKHTRPFPVLMGDYCDCLEPDVEAEPDAFTLSFHPAHQINGGGGGAVYFQDETLQARARSIAHWGRACHKRECFSNCDGCMGKNRYDYTEIGQNLAGSEINAVIALDNWQRRNEIARTRREYYGRIFDAARHLEIPHLSHFTQSPPFAVPILTLQPDRIKEYLREQGIQYRGMFSSAVEYCRAFGATYEGNTSTSHANWLFIGCHDQLTEAEVDAICAALRDYREEA